MEVNYNNSGSSTSNMNKGSSNTNNSNGSSNSNQNNNNIRSNTNTNNSSTSNNNNNSSSNTNTNNNITLLRTSLICPASRTPSCLSPLRLSPFDLNLQRLLYNQRILFYSLSSQQEEEEGFLSLIDSLKRSLSHALVHFYPLAGRLHRGKEKHLEVVCNDFGVEFIEAIALSASLQQMLTPLKPPLLYKLAPRPESKTLDGLHLPLLIIQVTKLEGGMAIGMSMNHIILDGTSVWHFLTSWAQLCRGDTSISCYPIHHRFNPEPILEKEESPCKFHILLPSPMLQERVVHFSSKAMAHLKKEANMKRRLVEGDNGKPISSYQALCGYLWKCISIARQLSHESKTTFSMPINCRSRLVPPLSKDYFGNAIHIVSITSKGGYLEDEEGASYAAQLLHDFIVGYDDQKIREKIQEYTIKGVILNCFVSGSNDVSLSGSFHFPCYETDFGWGKPVGVRSSLGNKCDGKITLFPGREGGGSVDAEIMIHQDYMPRLCKLLDSSSMTKTCQ